MKSEYLAGLGITNGVGIIYFLKQIIKDQIFQTSHPMFWNVPIYDPLHLLQLSTTSNLFLCPYFYFYLFRARKKQYKEQVKKENSMFSNNYIFFSKICSLFTESWFERPGDHTSKVK